MPNCNTEHSRALRAKTASERKKKIIAEGGHELRTLLEPEDYKKLRALVEWDNLRDHTSQRAVVLKLIRDAYKKLPVNARVHTDQIDAFSNPLSKRRPRYSLHGNAWTGRGRKPAWVLDYLEAGGDLKDIEIEEQD